MCDLIDLKSPDRKSLLGAKLASPLIPVPQDSTCGSHSGRADGSRSVIIGKRDSLENNPFDMVLHKTTEYIQKKDDPFEEALEKALKSKRKKNVPGFRTTSVDFMDDFSSKYKRHPKIKKVNRTLDESLISAEFNSSLCLRKIPFCADDNITADTRENDLKVDCGNVSFSKNDSQLPNIVVQDTDLSILNQSLMNDTLFDTSFGADKDEKKSVLRQRISMCFEKDRGNENLDRPKLEFIDSHDEEGFCTIPKSMMDSLKIRSTSSKSRGSSWSSYNSDNLFNDAFLKSRSSGNSVFSSLSNISSISKLNSVSSLTNTSMAMSNGTLNRTFLESCSSEKLNDIELFEKTEGISDKESALTMPLNLGSLPRNTLDENKFSTFDLIDRYNKLKARSSELNSTSSSKNETVLKPNFSKELKELMSPTEKTNKQNISTKLIDIDVFTPEINASKNDCRSSTSDSSLDSVFIEDNIINNSIHHEAQVLAKTFEELASKLSSEGSTDDLLVNNSLWMSELLPAFDDEITVDNLIELPASPNVNDTKYNSSMDLKNKQNIDRTSSSTKSDNSTENNKIEENLKTLEAELIEQIPTENRITATTLLLDLKKIVQTENNKKANKLLENLEKVLGIQYKSNTELLTTYLSATNNLVKSPAKPNNDLNLQNVGENLDGNLEMNTIKDLVSNKESVSDENMLLGTLNGNNSSESSEKSLKESKNELKDTTLERDSNADNSTEKLATKENKNIRYKADNSKKVFGDVGKAESDDSINEKMALKLLANLGKLLNEQTEDQVTVDLLKNLGKILNFASSNCNPDSKTDTDNTDVGTHRTPKKSKLKCENKIHASVLSKSANRFSLDDEPKKKSSSKHILRRSSTLTHNSLIKTIPNSSMSQDKSTSQLKEVKKRFPSDPGLINSLSTKKGVTSSSEISRVGGTGKGLRPKSTAIFDVPIEKPTGIATVLAKNKLKPKIDTEVVSKRGPLKAILPVGSMQRREITAKKVMAPVENVTPPKSHKIISSTPKSTEEEYIIKRSPRSKPVASSTPDTQNHKPQKTAIQPPSCSKKRYISCDISPVNTTPLPTGNSTCIKESPKRCNKLPSPKRTTPKRYTGSSNIPKSHTSPMVRKTSSSFDANQYDRILESPQRTGNKRTDFRKNSPIPLKKNGSKIQSPLRDCNGISPKVKPVNLISKLRRHSNSINVMEKENSYT